MAKTLEKEEKASGRRILPFKAKRRENGKDTRV